MKRVLAIVMGVFASAFVVPGTTSALMPATHAALNNNLVRGKYPGFFSLNLYLTNALHFPGGINEQLGESSARQSVQFGGQAEDEEPAPYLRSFNHFHDPLVSQWSSAGFNWGGVPELLPVGFEQILLGPHTSSAVWAQQENQGFLLGRYSWPAARNYFYQALTATSTTERNSNYAKCFRAIGQVMHLVQDASVPSHTRNDFHLFYDYERFVERLTTLNPGFLDSLATQLVYPPVPDLAAIADDNDAATIPIARLWDRDLYVGTNPEITVASSVGLAEYTNANFFSEDTVSGSRYPYPSLVTGTRVVELGIDSPRDPSRMVSRNYYLKIADGETGYRLAATGYLSDYLGDPATFKHYLLRSFPDLAWLITPVPASLPPDMISALETLSPLFSRDKVDWLPLRVVDDYCFQEYAVKLIPRATAYSAEIIRYFFRGALGVQRWHNITSSSQDGDDYLYIHGVSLSLANDTPAENLGPGTVQILCRWKRAWESEFHYQQTSIVEIAAIPAAVGVPQEIDFLLPDPLTYSYPEALEIEYTLVFRGRLGAEKDAVAAQVLATSLAPM